VTGKAGSAEAVRLMVQVKAVFELNDLYHDDTFFQE
jgi:hypothetical protein